MEDTKTRRDLNREARRTAIVLLARDIFLEQGYAATSMSTIATQLGGSKGTLWAYFPQKEDLFAAVLDQVTGIFRETLADALRPGRDCRTTLLDFSERFLAKMIGQMFYARGPQIVLDRLSAYIEERMAVGDLRADDPMQAAMNLIQLTQMQQFKRIWGVVGTPTREEMHEHALKALDLFTRAYAP
jgi:TetR/AcrR family transcriptional repressor of mexJK operon